MKFSGDFEIDELSMDDTWLVLTDPVALRRSIPGCQFLVAVEGDEVDFDSLDPDMDDTEPIWPEADRDAVESRQIQTGQTLAALMKVGIGPMKPEFEVKVNIDQAEFPQVQASGTGSGGGSEFHLDSEMNLDENDGTTIVRWEAQTDISGKIAQFGQRMLQPVANKLTNQFFSSILSQIQD